MEAGQLDRKITIQQPTENKDALGGVVTTWGTYKLAWSSIRYLRNKEGMESNQVVASRIVEFKIRTLDAPLVDETMRVSYDSGIYVIEGIQKLGRLETTILITKLKV